MKKKLLLYIAAMLLMCVSAFAQSSETPLKGDVNEDGKVDVADINAIIKIMKDGGGTAEAPTYYWYVGTTPIDDTNYNDTNIVSQVSTIPAETTITTNDEYLYIVVPKEKVITVYDENNFEINMKTYNSSTHSFTNAETYVGDYAIYRSTQIILGTSRIVVSD